MNVYSLLSTVVFMIDLYLGLHVLFLDKKSKIHRLFFFLCLSQLLWVLCAAFAYPSESKETLFYWFKISTFFWIPYFALLLHFCLVITKIFTMKWFYYLLVYIPPLLFIYGNLVSHIAYKDFVKVNDHWTFIAAADSVWFYFYLLYIHAYMVFSLVLLFLWNRKSPTVREKRQSFILFITLLLVLSINTVEGFVLPSIISYSSAGWAPIVLLIWMIGVWYAIVKYRFLSITPEMVSRDIIENIDESIILLDRQLRIVTINKKAEQLLQYKPDELKAAGTTRIIAEHELVQRKIKTLMQNETKYVSTTAHFINKTGSRIRMQIRLALIADKFNDIIGILIIGRELKQIKQLQKVYKLTEREVEVIQYILSGVKNKDIAAMLHITERTVKAHTASIYAKVSVSDKVEFLNFLKDFHLAPQQEQ
jgi:PAS domain S-box-containing protein